MLLASTPISVLAESKYGLVLMLLADSSIASEKEAKVDSDFAGQESEAAES